MANEEHLALLKEDVDEWNAWRDPRAIVSLPGPDLSGANLHGADLSHANLSRVDLRGADLHEAILTYADLSLANLRGANLRHAFLHEANLRLAELSAADLRRAVLHFTDLIGADLHGADLSGAYLLETVFGDVDLSGVIGLETCVHAGPSTIDFRTLWTLEKINPLPLGFLRGVGLPDALIDQLPKLLKQASKYYSCFISYSTKDDVFPQRLRNDLQNRGVRCWFAKHDMPISSKLLDELTIRIRGHDKMLLILSSHSIESEWVEDEVTIAFAEERERKRKGDGEEIVLFPIRIDDAVMTTDEAWARKLRDRHIGNFKGWKDPESYREALERLLRDLNASKV